MIGKDLRKSRTLIFNGLALLVGVAVGFGFKEFEAHPNIAPLAAGIVALLQLLLPILNPAINILLRCVTKEPLRFRR